MRFTENELTVALTGAGKVILATQRTEVPRGRADIDTVWDEMDRHQRLQLVDQLGVQILPVLVTLPDFQVAPATRPTYTDLQVRVEVLVSDVPGQTAPSGHCQDRHRAGAVGTEPPAAASRSRCPDRV